MFLLKTYTKNNHIHISKSTLCHNMIVLLMNSRKKHLYLDFVIIPSIRTNLKNIYKLTNWYICK